MRTLAAIAIALALTATGCKTNGTYVVVTFDKSATTPPGITQLDLTVMLAGRSATTSVNPGHEITFPNTAVLQIGTGTGMLTVDVVARDASGAVLDHGHGEGTVASGQTTNLTVALVGASSGVLTVDKPMVDFGTVVVHQSSTSVTVTVTNGGTVTSSSLSVALGDSANFAIAADGCSGVALDAGGMCPVTVKMTPMSAGMLSTMLTVGGMPGGSVASTLSGTAVMPGPLTLMPSMHDFGNLAQGSNSAEFTFTAANGGTSTSGALTVAISGSDAASFTLSNDQCTGKTLDASGQCPIGVKMTGTSAAGMKAATLTVSGMPGGIAVANLVGTVQTPAHLSMTYPANAFGSVTVGASSSNVNVVVTNDGQTSSGPLTATLLDSNTDFFLVSDGCVGVTLAPNGTCIVKFKFTPSTTGQRSATASVSATPGGTATDLLVGTGLSPAMLTITPNPKDYGIVDVGSSLTKTFTVKNNGQSPTGTLGSPGTPGPSRWAIVNDTCSGMTLAAGTTCTFDATFTPATYVAYSDTISISATPGGTASTNVSGTGRDFVTLTINIAGTGTGTVAASGATLSCTGSTCTAQFARSGSTFVSTTLSATPDASSTFSGFTGATCMGGATCGLTMDAAKIVTATFTIKTVTITIVESVNGSGAPTVTSTDGTISCSPTCGHTYSYSTSNLTLNETTGGLTFYGWSGAPCGTGSSCSFPLTRDRTITASFGSNATRNYMFITSTTQLPSIINGLAGADSICNARATAAGLPGTYSAWLSDNTTSARTRVGQGGWLRPDGRPFAAGIATLQNSPYQIFYPPRIDEFGNDLGNSQIFVYGAHGGNGQTFMGGNCGNWTTNMGDAYVGQASGASSSWSYDQLESGGCSTPHHIYCMRSDTTVAVSNPPTAARYAFISKAAFSVGGGLSAADTQCRSDATTAGLANPNTYIAFLATTTASASLRLNLAAGTLPFKRLDETLIVASPLDLASGALLAAPNEYADATAYVDDETWSGSADATAPGTATSTCSDWTSTAGTGALEGWQGATYTWLNYFSPACNYGFAHLLCFQP